MEKKEPSVENKPKVTTKKVDIDEIKVLNEDSGEKINTASNKKSVLKESNNKKDSPYVSKKQAKKGGKVKKLESDEDEGKAYSTLIKFFQI